MMKFYKLLALLALCATQLSGALPDDHLKALVAKSDQGVMDQLKHIGVYTGHVVADQGSTHLTADQLKIELDAHNQLVRVIAVGVPAVFSTVPHPNEQAVVAHAAHIEYDPKQNQVLLIGDALVIRNKDTYHAQTIYYDTLTQTVHSPEQTGQRITMVLQPQAS